MLTSSSSSSSSSSPVLTNDVSWWLVIEERRKTRTNVPCRNKWLALLFGQAITLAASSMNAASFTLSNHNKVDTHLFQLCIMYALLSTHLLFRGQGNHTTTADKEEPSQCHFLPFTQIRLHLPWWTYLLLSILDVIPNFMQLVSFRYTSLTSTTLLGSLTVPSTMFFSGRILGRCFGKYHYMGVLLTVMGGIMTVWADKGKDASVHSDIGDLLAVLAALMNGLQDVFAEYCVKNVNQYELLGMLGLFGALFTGLSIPWMEREALVDIIQDRSLSEQLEIGAVLAWYVASVLLYYIGEAFFLVSSDATLLNLSMQASNLWAILFSFLVYHALPPRLFYPALILVVSGVCVYEYNPTNTGTTDHPPNKEELQTLSTKSSQDSYSYGSTDDSDSSVV